MAYNTPTPGFRNARSVGPNPYKLRVDASVADANNTMATAEGAAQKLNQQAGKNMSGVVTDSNDRNPWLSGTGTVPNLLAPGVNPVSFTNQNPAANIIPEEIAAFAKPPAADLVALRGDPSLPLWLAKVAAQVGAFAKVPMPAKPILPKAQKPSVVAAARGGLNTGSASVYELLQGLGRPGATFGKRAAGMPPPPPVDPSTVPQDPSIGPPDPSQVPSQDPSQVPADPSQGALPPVDPSVAGLPGMGPPLAPPAPGTPQQPDPAANPAIGQQLAQILATNDQPEAPDDIQYDKMVTAYAHDRDKTAAQDNATSTRFSATGESTGLSFRHKADHYAKGPEAWASVSQYLKEKPKVEPDPFHGHHAGVKFAIEIPPAVEEEGLSVLQRLLQFAAKPGVRHTLGALAGAGGAEVENRTLLPDASPSIHWINRGIGAVMGGVGANSTHDAKQQLGLLAAKQLGLFGVDAAHQYTKSQINLANSQKSLTDTNLAAAQAHLHASQVEGDTAAAGGPLRDSATKTLKALPWVVGGLGAAGLGAYGLHEYLKPPATKAKPAFGGATVGGASTGKPKSKAPRLTLKHPGQYSISYTDPTEREEPAKAAYDAYRAGKQASLVDELKRQEQQDQNGNPPKLKQIVPVASRGGGPTAAPQAAAPQAKPATPGV